MKTVRKVVKKKSAARSRRLSLDQRLVLLAQSAEADRKKADADRKAFLKAVDADRKKADADRKAFLKAVDADRKKADADRKAFLKAAVEDRKKAEDNYKAAVEDRKKAEADRDRAVADRDRFSRLEKEVVDDRKKSEGHRRNLSRAMENAFAASLPRAMRRAHKIVIKPRDIRLRARVRKGGWSREFDFLAPNGKLVLAGEVKARLTYEDVVKFSDRLLGDFRVAFPEYAGLPVYGVVAGGVIDPAAAEHARRRGFYILRLEGAEVHPATARGYRATAY